MGAYPRTPGGYRREREEQPGLALTAPSTVALPDAPATFAAEPFHGDVEGEFVAGRHDAAEPHLFDAAEQRQPIGKAFVGQHGDRARLRQRLELQHAGKHRVAGEVAGQERLVAGHG